MLKPCTIVIFGATGDLAKKKLFPALQRLNSLGELHKETRILAIGRRDYDDRSFRAEFLTSCDLEHEGIASFCSRVHYLKLDFADGESYRGLKQAIGAADNLIFYLATAQDSFPIIVENLARQDLTKRSKLVIEKPFGSDLKSAISLNKSITKRFSEERIFRIDHYLGKQMVQEIMALRFANPLFNKSWDNKIIDNIQIVVNESSSVSGRAGYYDNSGALRDMVQNHILQLLALTMMERPRNNADINNKKIALLKAVRKESPIVLKKNVVLAQYTASDGVADYRSEQGVASGSKTETFAALKVFVDNPRWKGVPVYLKTGKALATNYVQIAVTFKEKCDIFCGEKYHYNTLIIRVQPDQGVQLQFNLKDPKKDMTTMPLKMEYSTCAEFGYNTKEAYEVLLSEAMKGDRSLFTQWKEVEESWRIVDNIKKADVPRRFYPAGSHGPKESRDLIIKDGRWWHGDNPPKNYVCAVPADK